MNEKAPLAVAALEQAFTTMADLAVADAAVAVWFYAAATHLNQECGLQGISQRFYDALREAGVQPRYEPEPLVIDDPLKNVVTHSDGTSEE